MQASGLHWYMELDIEQLSFADRYKLMIGAIVPRPIALVSSVSLDGKLNLAPFSFFNGVGSNPMLLVVCPANKPDGSEKDTLRNAKPVSEGGTGEFVVNVVSHAIAGPMVACSADLEYGESEFAASGLRPVASAKVKAMRVKESLVSFECVTHQVIRTNPGQPAGGNMLIGRVVWMHVADAIINTRHHIDAAGLDAIGRMGGADYCTSRDRFTIERPQ
jgi:flavin reductase (DIM6/NTAB) family NADH-FMN oxidoreductase RutF